MKTVSTWALLMLLCFLAFGLVLSGCGCGDDDEDTAADDDASQDDDDDDFPNNDDDSNSSDDDDNDAVDDDDDTGSDDCYDPVYSDISMIELTLPVSGDSTLVFYAEEAYEPLPLALLLQGALVDKQYYASFARQVAGYGFIVAVPNHERSGLLSGLYADLVTIEEAISFFTATNADDASPLFGRIDETRFALLGHSFGGAAALYAIQDICLFPFCSGGFERPDTLKAVALYGAHLTTMGVAPPIRNDGIALALSFGSLDGVATPAEVETSYQAVQTPPNALIGILGANHFRICDIDNPPGAEPDNSTPSLDQAVAVETLARWTSLFLRAHVLDDSCAYRAIHENGAANDPNVEIVSNP